MGGMGSGRESRGDAKRLVEDQFYLDSRSVRDFGLATDWPSDTVPVYRRGRAVVWAPLSVAKLPDDQLLLSLYAAVTKRLHFRVSLFAVSTPYRMGGVRWWLQCHRCERLIRFLYLQRSGMSCRKCGALVHRSTRTSHDSERLDAFFASASRLLGISI